MNKLTGSCLPVLLGYFVQNKLTEMLLIVKNVTSEPNRNHISDFIYECFYEGFL